ncbi:OmpH family outer membrane protein [Salegentibacter salarius]|uniref:Outer membrane chaperone Skp n=1 Tax=Salegentibacter salarius TaxID=435906 RepID=A0A2N0TZX3_9FLAO|nr:OmpH family outer membrane protein [Salegentibacter salarius]OEY73381.1 outer membrane chaperone Skp [Salegentibacter salarius]PKD20302.1 outer membrane chaperone Skp [Salegentibacter salarius]SLJ97062.1 periplasmic chaperone for outer membrane proteins Skp [Salegentibacter salarius]
MIRSSLLIAFLTFSIFASAQTKVGTIDTDYILSQMPEMEAVNKGLETYDKELQQDFQANVKQYDTLVKTYQANAESLAAEARQESESKIIELENQIKQFRQRAQLMMQMRRNELTNPLYKKIDAAMRAVIDEEGFTQILHAGGNSIAFSAEEYDITEKVMNKMGIEIPVAAEEE